LKAVISRHDVDGLRTILMELVPEFNPDGNDVDLVRLEHASG
jgi:hypothetical protein